VFVLRAPSSSDVPVLLLNQPISFPRRENTEATYQNIDKDALVSLCKIKMHKLPKTSLTKMGNYLISCVIRNDLLKLRRAKITERFKTRRFGVIMMPLSTENNYEKVII